MPAIPGQPYEPTIHPRTKNEASEYALKNRTTNDWMRHDGKNFETLSQPAPRTGVSKLAAAIAIKARGDAANWFQHDPNAPPEPRPAPRCPAPEAKVAFEKVYGKNETWHKHDDNMHYYEKVPDRLGAVGGKEIKEKFVSDEASKRIKEWYHHDHGPNDNYKHSYCKHNTGATVQKGLENERKIQGENGVPKWFHHKNAPSSDDYRPKPKVMTQEAMDYMLRDRVGIPIDANQTMNQPEPGKYHPNVVSREAEEIAVKLAGESGDWFSHGQKAGEGFSRTVSAPVQEMLNKEHKGKMRQILGMDQVGNLTPAGGSRAVKPEAEMIAKHHSAGTMSHVFNENENRNYTDPAYGAPRVIRPEAAENFERNKGVIGDCFQGYRDPAWNKKRHKLPPTDEIAAKHCGSTIDGVIKGTGPLDSGGFHMGRGVRPEAEEIARKHLGSSMFDVFQAGSEEYVKKPPKVRSDLAAEIAERSRGSVANLII